MVSSRSVEDGDEPDEQKSQYRLIEHLRQEITPSWGDAVLLSCCFAAGLLDAGVFNVWSCFVGMQTGKCARRETTDSSNMNTGNTIYAGLGVAGLPADQPYRWIKSLTSIACYIFGCAFFSRVQRWMQPLRRGTLAASFTLQALCCLVSAALTQTGVVPLDAGEAGIARGDYIVLLPLGMLAFQAGGQTVISRVLGYNEIPSVVLTSTYCDLAMDEKLITAPPSENVKRNRRVASVIMFFAAAVAGGFLTKDGDLTKSLWIAGSIKAVIAVVWMFWKSKDDSVRLE